MVKAPEPKDKSAAARSRAYRARKKALQGTTTDRTNTFRQRKFRAIKRALGWTEPWRD